MIIEQEDKDLLEIRTEYGRSERDCERMIRSFKFDTILPDGSLDVVMMLKLLCNVHHIPQEEVEDWRSRARLLTDYEYYLVDEMNYFFEVNPAGEYEWFGKEDQVQKFIDYKIRKEKLRGLQSI